MTFAIRTFVDDDCGAVTVDWVVLTAAVVGLGIAVIATIDNGVDNLGTDVGNSLSNATVNELTMPDHGN